MTFQKISVVKVGIIGLGLVSDLHIKGYQSHSNAQVVAVCDLDEHRVKQVCQKYGIEKYYTAYEEMLKGTQINVIDIVTPTHLHAPMALAAALCRHRRLARHQNHHGDHLLCNGRRSGQG